MLLPITMVTLPWCYSINFKSGRLCYGHHHPQHIWLVAEGIVVKEEVIPAYGPLQPSPKKQGGAPPFHLWVTQADECTQALRQPDCAFISGLISWCPHWGAFLQRTLALSLSISSIQITFVFSLSLASTWVIQIYIPISMHKRSLYTLELVESLTFCLNWDLY